jgi:hypothetical protein
MQTKDVDRSTLRAIGDEWADMTGHGLFQSARRLRSWPTALPDVLFKLTFHVKSAVQGIR